MRLTSIEGDMALGRHAAVGGDASIKGSAIIGHNLLVRGWLDAPNILGSDKGLHASLQALEEAYPHPRRGWWAMVGATLPATLCVVEDGCWVSTGKPVGGGGGSTADLGEVTQAISGLQARVEALEQAVAGLESESKTARFDSIVNSLTETLKEQSSRSSTDPECSVVYVNTLGRFVLKVETVSVQGGVAASYYGWWADSGDYAGGDGKPLTGVTYVCRSNGQAYRWTGTALEAV